MGLQHRNLVITLFILSGFSSLIFQSVWVRVLSLAVGSTSTAMSLVLSIFFFGLAAGSYLAGKYSKKIKNPLWFYGLIEGLIGLYAFALIYVLLGFHQILAFLPMVGPYAHLGTAAKFALVFLLLVVPTVGMGASLPLLIRLFVDDAQKSEKQKSNGSFISLLYGINTLGAVLGAFSASFVLIPKTGLLFANHLAATVNLVILAAAFVLVYFKPKAYSIRNLASSGSGSFFKLGNVTRRQAALLFVCLMSGFASIAAEVVWNKYLGIFFGTNIYGLGIILSIFLLGIAIGSLLLSSQYHRIASKDALQLRLLIASICMLLVTSYLLNLAPVISGVIVYYVGDYLNLLAIKSIVTAAMILPSTIVFGALLPLTIDLLIAEKTEDSSQVTGIAYAINTFGSICGSCLAGLVLVPVWGSSAAITVSVLALSSSAFVLLYDSFAGQLASRRTLATCGVALIAITVFGVSSSNINFKNILKSAYFQASKGDQSLADVLRFYTKDHEEFKLIVEGETAITSLSHDKSDGEGYQNILRLKTNGLNESLYNKDHLQSIPKYEGLLGLLPYVFGRDPDRAFVVGYGGGYTVDLLTSLNIPNVYVAELEKGIIDAANYVYKDKNPVLARSNLNLKIEDARFVLAAKVYDKFDVVVSQPSHSWLTGVANLFTKEFFEIVSSNLSEKGIYSQWLNLYNMDQKVLKSILKTFYTVFPHGHVFTDIGDEELIMLGSNKPLQIDMDRLQALTKNPALKEKLSQLHFDSAESFLTNFAISRDQLWPKISDAELNTDINVFAEANQSNLFYSAGKKESPAEYLVEQFTGDYGTVVKGELGAESAHNLAEQMYHTGKLQKLEVLLDQSEEKGAQSVLEQERAGYLSYLVGRYDKSLEYFQRAFKKAPSTYNLNRRLQVHAGLGEHQKVLGLGRKHLRLQDANSKCYLAAARHGLGKLSLRELLALERSLESLEASCVELGHKVIGLAYLKRQNTKKALYHLESIYSEDLNDPEVLTALSAAYLLAGDVKRGVEFAEYLRALSDSGQTVF